MREQNTNKIRTQYNVTCYLTYIHRHGAMDIIFLWCLYQNILHKYHILVGGLGGGLQVTRLVCTLKRKDNLNLAVRS